MRTISLALFVVALLTSCAALNDRALDDLKADHPYRMHRTTISIAGQLRNFLLAVMGCLRKCRIVCQGGVESLAKLSWKCARQHRRRYILTPMLMSARGLMVGPS